MNDYTALRSIDLLEWQEASGVTGPLFEIGVYAGRYFSLLARSAWRNGDTAVGLDTFQWVDMAAVSDHHLKPLQPMDSYVRLKAAKSTEFSATELLAVTGGRPRFISIDGSHERDDVAWDLRLAEEILGSKGIVAVDDFLNPLTLGVNQAVNTFFQSPRNLAPFAYIQNKLFLSRLHHAEACRLWLERRIESLSDERSQAWLKDRARERGGVETVLWGHKTLIIG